MSILSKSLLAAVSISLLSSPVLADHITRRIVHPNGPDTYVTAQPAESHRSVLGASRGATIGVFAGDRSFGERRETMRSESWLKDSEGRMLVPIHRGHGETFYVPVQR